MQLDFEFTFCKSPKISRNEDSIWSRVCLRVVKQPPRASLPSLSSWALHKATIVSLLFKPIPVAQKKALHSEIPSKKHSARAKNHRLESCLRPMNSQDLFRRYSCSFFFFSVCHTAERLRLHWPISLIALSHTERYSALQKYCFHNKLGSDNGCGFSSERTVTNVGQTVQHPIQWDLNPFVLSKQKSLLHACGIIWILLSCVLWSCS